MALTVNQAIATQASLAYLGRPQDVGALTSFGLGLSAGAVASPTAAQLAALFATTESKAVFGTTATMSSVIVKSFELVGRVATSQNITDIVTWATSAKLDISQLPWEIMKIALSTESALPQASQVAWARLSVAYQFAEDISANATALQSLATSTTQQDAARAVISGVTSFATIATAYPASGSGTAANFVSGATATGQTFILTTDANSGSAFVGTTGNDTYNALGTAFWSLGDAIDGAGGADTLNVTQTGAISQPLGATVTNIETINLTSGSTNVLTTTTGFSGLTSLNATGVTGATITSAATTAIAVTDTTSTAAIAVNGGSTVSVTSTGNNGGNITVGATTAAAGAVTVSSTSLVGSTAGTIGVTGGTVVSVTQAAGGTAVAGTTSTAGAVTVTGNASTTTVSVADSVAAAGFTATATLAGVRGHTNGAVTITDVNSGSATAAGVLKSVTLNSFAAATVNSGALTSLTLQGTGTSAAVTMGALTTPTVTALALNVNGLTTTGAVTTPTVTTLNIASSTAASTIADLVAAAATTINVSGDALLTISANTNIAATTISSSAQTAGGLSLTAALGTAVTFTGGAGADTISIGSTTKTITMGAGNDTVITSTGLIGTGGTVAAGAGTADKITFSTTANAVTAGGSSTFNTSFTGFEVIELTNALAGTMNVSGINNASTVILIAGGGHISTAIIQDIASGGTVDTRVAGTGFVVNVLSATGGATDVLNLKLTNTTATTFTSMTAANVETININVADAAAGTAAAPASAAVTHLATLVAVAATTVTVTGNNGLALTNTGNIAITKFDASGVVANDTSASVTTAGASVAATVDTAANMAVTFGSLNTTVSASITITGGAGNDVLSGHASVLNSNTISGGLGDDTITGGLSTDTLSGGAGADTLITQVTGTAAGAADVLTGGLGADVYTLRGDVAASGAMTVAIATAAAARITDFSISGTNGVDILSLSSTFGNYSGASGFTTHIASAGTTAAGATVVMALDSASAGTALTAGTDLIRLSASTAVTGTFQQLFNAAIGTSTATGISTAGLDIFFSLYDSTNSKMLVGVVDSGGNDIIATGDTVTLIGSLDMTAANYALFTTANLALVTA